jgi:hypothetical protein
VATRLDITGIRWLQVIWTFGFQLRTENASRIVTSLKEFGFDPSELSVTFFLQPDNILRMGVEPLRIEILTSVSGVTFDQCYQDRIIDLLDGIEVTLISLKHLKHLKTTKKRAVD